MRMVLVDRGGYPTVYGAGDIGHSGNRHHLGGADIKDLSNEAEISNPGK